MENSTISTEIIDPIFSCDNTIQDHLDNLNELMIYWLTVNNLIRKDDEVFSTHNTYYALKDILNNLKPVEVERNLYWKKRNSYLVNNMDDI
jgi:hypothetical protein